jgi:hypothetical protein
VTIRNALATCQEIVDGHIIEVWQLIHNVIQRLAFARPGMLTIIMYVVLQSKLNASRAITDTINSQAMIPLQQATALKTRTFSHGVVEVGASDPSKTGTLGDSVSRGLQSTAKFTVENFDRVYRPKSTGSSANESRAQDVSTIPAGVSDDDIKDILRLQAEIDIGLGLSIYRTGTVIGQKVQVDILAMLDQVEGTLRSAFQLDLVQDSVRKRSRALFETKGDRVKRAKLLEKEKSLSEIE